MTAGGWTVPDIITKVRNITGTSNDELSDDQILTYMNNYYVWTMPFEIKNQIQLKYFDFTTVNIQDTYDFNATLVQGDSVLTNFVTNQPTCWADGMFVNFYQDPNIFWKDFPQQYAQDQIGTGDGETVEYSGTVQSMQVIIGTFFVTDGVQVAQDNGNGKLVQTDSNNNVDNVGVIDYTTGVWSVNFLNASANGNTIFAKYQAMQAAMPQGVLFFNNQLTFRPIPDTVYQIRLQGYILPKALVNDSTSAYYSPTLTEWGQLVAYGAAVEIFADRADNDGQATAYANLKRYESVALSRYIQQYQSQRPAPRF